MSLENVNVDKWSKIINFIETKLWPIVLVAMAYIIYYQATWIRELENQRHEQDKEYMLFFRDQYNETNKYLNYSRRHENIRSFNGSDTLNNAD